ncbi:MAG: LysE family translocator [Pseudomonadota bacterium]
MPDIQTIGLFVAAALVLAVMPGPGILYVGARTLSGGRGEGIASSLGTAVGGFGQVLAGAAGFSALLLASAQAFTVIKLIGAAYLVWLGISALLAANKPLQLENVAATGSSRAFRDGIIVELLNPKTAAFFLAFLPQFIDPAIGSVALQFLILGAISVVLNTLADIVIAYLAGGLRATLTERSGLLKNLQRTSGLVLCSLGIALVFARRPA